MSEKVTSKIATIVDDPEVTKDVINYLKEKNGNFDSLADLQNHNGKIFIDSFEIESLDHTQASQISEELTEKMKKERQETVYKLSELKEGDIIDRIESEGPIAKTDGHRQHEIHHIRGDQFILLKHDTAEENYTVEGKGQLLVEKKESFDFKKPSNPDPVQPPINLEIKNKRNGWLDGETVNFLVN
jgi:hypothetical protein